MKGGGARKRSASSEKFQVLRHEIIAIFMSLIDDSKLPVLFDWSWLGKVAWT